MKQLHSVDFSADSPCPTPRIGVRLRVFIACCLAALCCVAGLVGCGDSSSSAVSNTNEKVRVVASFYPMADFAQKIGGDYVEVTNLVPSGTEPHEWEPTAQDIVAIEDADVFVYNGADMEGWVDDALSSVDASRTQVVEASQGIELRIGGHDHEAGEETVEHEDEDAHDHEGEYDPHVWLDPQNAKVELENIKEGLVAADPEHAEAYEANYEEYAKRCDELDQEYIERLEDVDEDTIVVSHEAYGYLCDAYGLTQLAITGMDAEGEPDAATMAEIADFVEENNVQVIFSEELVSPKVAQAIADETGAQCEQLNPLEGLTDEQIEAGSDYFSVMDENLDKLVEALSRD